MPRIAKQSVSGIRGKRIAQSDVVGLWLRGLRVQSPSLTPDSNNTSQVVDFASARLSRELAAIQADPALDLPRLEVALAEFVAVAS